MRFSSDIGCENCKSILKSIFYTLNNDQLQFLLVNKSCSMYKKGQYIFNRGAHPQGLFCVHSGKIKLSRTGDEGKEQIVRSAGEGDVIGYRALLSNDRYQSSAIALEDAAICFIPRQIFYDLLASNLGLAFEMMKLLSGDLKKAEQMITTLAQKPVRERMAETLLFLKETYGFEEDGITLNVTLTREELANLVGTATETGIRLLSEFKIEKIIELVGKRIKIINMPNLIKTANLED